jgi:hypothetical protein
MKKKEEYNQLRRRQKKTIYKRGKRGLNNRTLTEIKKKEL